MWSRGFFLLSICINLYQSVEIYRNLYKSVDKKNDLKIN